MSGAPEPAAADWVRRLLPPPGPEVWRQFADEPEALRAAVVRALKARVDELVRNEPPAARPVAEALVLAAQGLPGLLPLALRGRAVAAHFTGDEAAARADFEHAVELYEADGRAVEAATTRRSLVDVYQMSGDSAAALACAEQARAVLEAHGQTRLLAQLQLNVGNVHTRLDDYPRAREHYAAARELFDTLDDDVGRAFADFNLAVVEMNGDRVELAERRWHDARAGMQAAGMGLLVADCDYNLAYLQSRRGRFESAIDGLERARRAYDEQGKPSGPALCDLDLAEIHLRLDARRDALAYATRAAGRFAELGLEYERARAEVLAGTARARLGAREAALQDLYRAGERFARLGNRAFASCVEIQRASLQIDQGAPRGAASRLALAEATLRRHGMPWLAALAALVRARALLALERPREALELLSGLDARPDDTPGDGLLESLACRLRAEAQAALGDAAGALASLRRAVEGIETSYAHVPAGDVRLAFFRDQHPAFVDLAFALLESDQARDALLVLEQGRSRSLREVPPAAGGDAAAFRAARERLDWLLSRRLDDQLGFAAGRHELRAPPDGEARGACSREIEATRDELSRLAARRGPAGALPRLSASELSGSRRGDELALLYVTGPQGAWAFVHHGDDADGPRLEGVKLPLTEERLALLCDGLLFQMGRLQLGGEYLARHERGILAALDALFAELGERLLEPVRRRHPSWLADGRPLLVVPYGRLHDLPFHAFHLDGHPLAARHDVAYGLSAWQLARARTPRAGRTGESGTIWMTGLGQDALPHVERELGAIEALYAGDCRRLEPAELCAGLQAGAIRGRILHIAGHGRFESRHPRFSAICLGQTSLLAHDISNMDLHLDLVTLSGCETGRKLRIGGDELLGLPRALVGAGARAVLASHWPVDDGDAASFMQHVYGELAAGRPARRAVAVAQRRLRERAVQPLSWAAFSLLGDPDVVAPAGPRPATAPPS